MEKAEWWNGLHIVKRDVLKKPDKIYVYEVINVMGGSYVAAPVKVSGQSFQRLPEKQLEHFDVDEGLPSVKVFQSAEAALSHVDGLRRKLMS